MELARDNATASAKVGYADSYAVISTVATDSSERVSVVVVTYNDDKRSVFLGRETSENKYCAPNMILASKEEELVQIYKSK